MSSHPSLGFIGFSQVKAEIARTLQSHKNSTLRSFSTSAENLEDADATRSDSILDIAQHSQVTWIEEKDAQSLSDSLLGSSGLVQGMRSYLTAL
jgi:hypothetical protein